jgi:hypothetical protein
MEPTLLMKEKAFFEVNGFTGIDHIASGDDMLLMQKIAQRFPGKISYMLSKDAIVHYTGLKNMERVF